MTDEATAKPVRRKVAKSVDAVPPVDPMAVGLAKGVEIDPDRLEAVIAQERAVIGQLLLTPDAMVDTSGLEPEHFAIDQFRRVFAAMRQIGEGWTARALHDLSGVNFRLIMSCTKVATTRISLPDDARDLRRAAIIRAMRASAVKIAANGAGASPGDLAASMRAAADQAEGLIEDGINLNARELSDALFDHLETMRNGGGVPGASTGFRSLDSVLIWRPEELVVLAARPGMGKTVFMVSSARATAARLDCSVGLFSLEINKIQFASRLFADDMRGETLVNVPFGVLMRGSVRRETEEALAEASRRIANMGIYSAFRGGITVGEIEATIEGWKKQAEKTLRPLRVVFIDYLKFISLDSRYQGNRTLEIGETTKALKQMAKRHGITIVLLCQLNREVEKRPDKRPMLSDLRDSGEIEQDADVVLMLFREAYYLKKSQSAEDLAKFDQVEHQVEVLIEKNRPGEAGIAVKLWCDVVTSSMRDFSTSEED